jgi:hypothetical protein
VEPDSNRIASIAWEMLTVGAEEGRLTLWDAVTAKKIRAFDGISWSDVGPPAWLANGAAVALDSGYAFSIQRVSDGARVVVRAARATNGCALLAVDDRGHFEAGDGAMPLVAVRTDEDLLRTPMLTSGPELESLRKSGLLGAVLTAP